MPRRPSLPRNPLDEFVDQVLVATEDLMYDFLTQGRAVVREALRQSQGQIPGQPGPIPPSPERPRAPRPRRMPPGPRTRPEPPNRTLYAILEVSENASQETISAAFRSLGRRYHTDNKKTGNENRFKAITAAYAVLKDPVRRRAYDRTGKI